MPVKTPGPVSVFGWQIIADPSDRSDRPLSSSLPASTGLSMSVQRFMPAKPALAGGPQRSLADG